VKLEHVETNDNDQAVAEHPLARRVAGFAHYAERWTVPAVLVLAIVIFSLALPGVFMSSGNILSILSAQAVPLMLALGVLLPLRCNQFDLSVAQIMVFSGAVTGVLSVNQGWGLPQAMIAGVLTGAVCGLVNGVLCVLFSLNSFVVTLGTSSVLVGLTYAITDSQSIQPMPSGMTALAITEIAGIQLMVWIAWLLALVIWVVLEFTPYGRYLLFIGGNARASSLVGIKTRTFSLSTFVVAAVIAAVAGILLAGSLDTVNPSIGGQFLLTPYAAAFLGAAAIQVGRFNVWGTVFAVYLVSVGQTGLILLGSPTWVSNVFEGLILVAAIGFSRLVRRG
jgi:ribose transport system permease protein